MEPLGILLLGQTPRPDIEQLFSAYLPGARLILRGALDGVSAPTIDALADRKGDYPLFVILADGTTREIGMQLLMPHLQAGARDLQLVGVGAAVLFCTGDFPDLGGELPLIYPGRIVPAVVTGVCRSRRIGVITPNPGQAEPTRRNWDARGFAATVLVASPKDPVALEAAAQCLREPELELVVLDCMGFPPSAANRLRAMIGKPVLCSQSLVARTAAELIGSYPLT